MDEATVLWETGDEIAVIRLNRPEARNAVDRTTARALAAAFRRFEADDALKVAVLTGAGGSFCAGADLKALASAAAPIELSPEGDGPMGPTRMLLSKPVIAAIEGYAVAGGLELALWCDLRVCARDAAFGVFCRRFGVPLVDLGTVRLPRIIGHGRALDMILTGRAVGGVEALEIGLANRIAEPGRALEAAVALAREIARLPQRCMRSDRLSTYEQWDLSREEAMKNELRRGGEVIRSGETLEGAARFASGQGRHGGVQGFPE